MNILCSLGLHKEQTVGNTEWVVKTRCIRCNKVRYFFSNRPLSLDINGQVKELEKR